jgi:N6-L-threonylcarbamoyladenine synthase
MIVLGIETSCDETAAAIVNGDGVIIAENVLSQLDDHRPYGGVVPEVAARAHLEHVDVLISKTMAKAGLGFHELDAVAATGGPGLIGGVIVGVMTAKAIATACNLPFLAINHMEGHALSARLSEAGKVAFPYLLLLMSGGHCQLLDVEGPGRYKRLGTTIDDALGEAFDKTAKMLGIGYPGGPAVEAAAKQGNAARFALPRPMKGRPGCDFSFSGLKTAVRHVALGLPEGPLQNTDIADLCASFQAAAGDVLADRISHALDDFLVDHPGGSSLVISGGVAANQFLRQRLQVLADQRSIDLIAPAPSLCTDNGAMIAWAAIERIQDMGMEKARDNLNFKPRPRWPLDPHAPTAAFAGVKA